MHSWATRLMALHCLNWLRVFRGINPVPFGPRVAQTCESRVGPQAKYAACRGSMSDGMYRIAAYLCVHSSAVRAAEVCIVSVNSFLDTPSLKLCGLSQGTLLLLSHLGRGFVAMPPNQPRRIILMLKLMQRQAESFHGVKGLEP